MSFMNHSYLCTLYYKWYVILLTLHLFCKQSSSRRFYLFILLVILWIEINTFFFSFQMNNDKDLLEYDMGLDDDVLYNFVDATSQLMKSDGVKP